VFCDVCVTLNGFLLRKRLSRIVGPEAEARRVAKLRRVATSVGREGQSLFAWRRRPTLFNVLVAEVMLQHTPTARVVPVYERFLRSWPSPGRLAVAPISRLERTIETLGLHRSRARFLRGLGRSLTRRKGRRSSAQLGALPGIGPYTAGVTAAVVSRERVGFVDGGIARLVRRFDGQPTMTMRAASDRVATLMSAGDPRLIAWGLLDISRTTCRFREPLCLTCDLQGVCRTAAADGPHATKTSGPAALA